MKAVFRRELHSLMHSVWGWLVLCSVPFAFAVMTTLHLLSGSAADYIRVVMDSTIAFALIMPVYAAQGFSKDKRTGANVLLHSLPISPAGMVAGRYLAWCAPFACGVALSCLYPVALGCFAQIALWQTAAGFVLYLLNGMAVIAVALFVSRFSSKGAVNAIAALALFALSYFANNLISLIMSSGASGWMTTVCIALIALFFAWKATRDLVSALACALLADAAVLLLCGADASWASAFWNRAYEMVGLQSNFASLYIGVFDLGSAVFFPLAVVLMLALCAQGWRMEAFERRRGER